VASGALDEDELPDCDESLDVDCDDSLADWLDDELDDDEPLVRLEELSSSSPGSIAMIRGSWNEPRV
jgi:hypothetical protein